MNFTVFGITITWSWIVSFLIGMIGIGIMIWVHELGHAAAARMCGINVERLSFGFGPPLIKWRHRDTQYVIAAIPFGGACKMSGGDDIQNAITQKKKHIESAEDGSIWSVGPLKRIFAYAAGPIANMLFAFLCYALLMTMPTIIGTYPAKVVLSNDYPALYNVESTAASEAGMMTGDTIVAVEGIEVSNYTEMQQALAKFKTDESVKIQTKRGFFTVHPKDGVFGFLPFQEPIVGHVNTDTPEKAAGLRSGDRIIVVNGKSVNNMIDLLEASYTSDHLTMTVRRGEETVDLEFDNPTKSLNFTLQQQTMKIPGTNFFKALGVSVRECFTILKGTVNAFFGMFARNKEANDSINGTFTASQSIGMLTTMGFAHGFNSGMRTVLYLLASVSISLAVANLLPIPALDGGLILVSLAELITRRTFHPKMYLSMQIAGTIMIALFFVGRAIVSFM